MQSLLQITEHVRMIELADAERLMKKLLPASDS
jgi:hypothetical protein